MKKEYIKPIAIFEEFEPLCLTPLSRGKANTGFPDDVEEYVPDIPVDNNDDNLDIDF